MPELNAHGRKQVRTVFLLAILDSRSCYETEFESFLRILVHRSQVQDRSCVGVNSDRRSSLLGALRVLSIDSVKAL